MREHVKPLAADIAEARKEAKRQALQRKGKHIFSKLSNEHRKVVDMSMSANMNVYKAAHQVTPDDPIKARQLAREILRNPSVMEFMYDGQNLKLIPALALLGKTNMVFWDILNDAEGDANLKVKVGQIIHSSLKESGALSLYQRAMEQDIGDAKTNDELAREILRMKEMKRIAPPADESS